MIRINLIKPGSPDSKDGAPKVSGKLISLIITVFLVGGAGYGVYYMMSTGILTEMLASSDKSEAKPDDKRETGITEKPEISPDDKREASVDTKTDVKPQDKSMVVAAAPVSVPAPSPAAVPAAVPLAAKAPAPQPSSLVRTNMIENVVRELGNESRAVKKFDAAYEDMNTVEKINYEVLFGRNAFELITRAVPPGVRLKTIEIENFQTIYTSGAGASREMVQELFSAFRRDKGELLPKPLSHIKDDASGGYQFVVTAKPRFGLELDDPFQALDHLGFKESLAVHLRNFSRLAGENGFKLAAQPGQIAVERAGSYRRVVYKAQGESTYRDFHKFVLALYDQKVPCAFKKVTLTAKNDNNLRVATEILFTVKE
ncbi:MAG: hypothetical protein LBI42_07365 [Chitinispirillales bacterium]|jgi:hypothetical protein|nr:hypothetical protein [Chitinispirillales bacterium]